MFQQLPASTIHPVAMLKGLAADDHDPAGRQGYGDRQVSSNHLESEGQKLDPRGACLPLFGKRESASTAGLKLRR